MFWWCAGDSVGVIFPQRACDRLVDYLNTGGIKVQSGRISRTLSDRTRRAELFHQRFLDRVTERLLVALKAGEALDEECAVRIRRRRKVTPIASLEPAGAPLPLLAISHDM